MEAATGSHPVEVGIMKAGTAQQMMTIPAACCRCAGCGFPSFDGPQIEDESEGTHVLKYLRYGETNRVVTTRQEGDGPDSLETGNVRQSQSWV